jgi:predicted nucleotidyltransferase
VLSLMSRPSVQRGSACQTVSMFTVEEREAVFDAIIALVSEHRSIVGAAVVGSLADPSSDRFSDIDLTFAVKDGIDLTSVLDDLTEQLRVMTAIDVLFDLPFGPTLYRVLLFPAELQVDLSVTAASAFARRGPNFRLLFGTATMPVELPAQPLSVIAGYAVHHALHASTSIERDRYAQAAYWIGELRNEALHLAMSSIGADPSQARGAHLLPAEVLLQAERTLSASFQKTELKRALVEAIELLKLVLGGRNHLGEGTLAQLSNLLSRLSR